MSFSPSGKTNVNTVTNIDQGYSLDDRYTRASGRVFLTGTQALVRLPMLQALADRAKGLNTAGFISGYRGSPLGMYDQALWQAKKHLEPLNIHFQPAINEDLAATAIMGTQQVETEGSATVDGVFGLWYGKGPGVDRSGDALKHGNAFGSSPHGGVLVVCGDDHGVVSSSMPHQSDQALMAWSMPVLNPASVEEYLSFGLFGWALSRFTGAWIGFKAISETVESATSIALPETMPAFLEPADFVPPPGGLHYRNGDLPSLAIEERLRFKLQAVRAFVRANREVFAIDRAIVDKPDATLGIVTAGKAHLDLMEALRLLGLDETALKDAGIRVRKLGLTFPIEPVAMEDFCTGLSDLLVVEEKGPVVEGQIKDQFYNAPADRRPRLWGKNHPDGAAFLPGCGEMRPARLARSLAEFLDATAPFLQAGARLVRAGLAPKGPEAASLAGINGAAKRMPYFCSGCPHNTSTKVPDGSKAYAGIGCHFMANWMDRETSGLTQMGGEGVNWIGLAPFTKTKHVFQNLGDGTYYHSGLMAIRQAVAAKANITYKILYNDAVAMTGGQPVDGTLSVPQIVNQLRAEGVERIEIVTDDTARYGGFSDVPVHDRAELDAVQRDLCTVGGVSALIYDQTCATEKRRRRKKGDFPDPAKRVVINDLVCEGCGDCGVKSNCLSVAPLETEFGTKREIDQSSCNKDYSCQNGFCPSFVTVEGGQLRRKSGADIAARLDALPLPVMREHELANKPSEILVAGVGGTGVVTVGALITMAAHLEGRPASVLDFMGFAQKGGAVLSHVRIGARGTKLNQVRIEPKQADLLLACDLVVGTSPEAIATLDPEKSRVIANSQTIHTAAFLKDPKAIQKPDMMLDILYHVLGEAGVDSLNATKAALTLMGDSIGANILMLGYAWQKGEIPVSLPALTRAIELNGVAVAANKRVFGWGRLLAADPDAVRDLLADGEDRGRFKPAESLDEIIARRVDFLTGYQNAAYADRFVARIENLRKAEKSLNGKTELTEAASRSLFKLMAYKDEYEVARLFTESDFEARLAAQFEGDYKIAYHLAPPGLSRPGPNGEEPAKRRFGPWLRPAMKGLARLKGLRGSWADPFGYPPERRTERALIQRFEATLDEIAATLTPENRDAALALLSLPMEIRGFGPVKERALKTVMPEWDALEDTYRNPPEPAFQFAAE
ncbi:indolepyruvate ferredoxin oxidoreductase family protein [Hwanghaeella grinnelliae]|uniref:Indolepyruvate ferredoxin oxidoreductase family protein n=1 Tax=Hwanghaeella grinnelliae TaxID=2500179 RepID=A0A3S3UPI8_9PROT|nr:indolepyruvate ferredoxin oxidoreductase family protein [Hwanghaeella grinnelliae]RVU36778.1 indolepyruvate ferredoxin oxidoreductase family protein [Hwanghaeella grinnelliae]